VNNRKDEIHHRNDEEDDSGRKQRGKNNDAVICKKEKCLNEYIRKNKILTRATQRIVIVVDIAVGKIHKPIIDGHSIASSHHNHVHQRKNEVENGQNARSGPGLFESQNRCQQSHQTSGDSH
jgi:hypothetical protein